MKKKNLLNIFKKPKDIAIIGCLIIITFLSISNFNLTQKNNVYKKYASEMVVILEQYEVELKEINEFMISIKDQIIKPKSRG